MAESSSHPAGLRRTHDVLAGAAAALLAFVAVPAALALVVGDPLAGGLGHEWQPAWRDAFCVATLAAWVAWAVCSAQLLRAVLVLVLHARTGAVVTPATVVDRLAARIALGVLAVSSVGAPLAPVLTHAAGAAVVQRADASLRSTPPTTPAVPGALETETHQSVPYTVQHGDSLWSIADHRLQDGAAWTALASLNLGRSVARGRRFVDPAHLQPGWHLVLPVEATVLERAGTRRPEPGKGQKPRSAHESGPGNQLPEIAALGLGSLVCAGLARRTRRRRPPRFSEDPHVELQLSEAAVDTAALVQRFAGVPALDAFESSNRLLGWLLADEPTRPTVRAARVSSTGVTFWLAGQERLRLPDGFVAVEGGAAWHIAHEGLSVARERHPQLTYHPPLAPVALPVGDDDEGTWLVAVGPGQVLPLVGTSALALERSMRTATAAWAWSDTLVVADDPTDPGFSREAGADASVGRHLVYFGPPESLSADLARRAAVVTTSATSASDLTVLVDRHGATIHPLGRLVRPHLQSEAVAASLGELLSADAPARSRQPDAVPPPVRTAPRLPRGGSGTAAVTPGTVDVRLLTMTPRLDGLREDLPPNRVRRAVELVAYLALHAPDVITSDRLRTRVLGSSDADAASKTLFNVAHAARRALGTDEAGRPLLPPGTRTGEYQISPAVTIDVRRAASLVEEGRAYAEESGEEAAGLAIAHFRAALELVESEPLANALSGFTWWEAEGHGARLGVTLVEAASTMADLAADKEQFALARWGIGRARLAAPYSETLSRAAMRLAAAEGDAERLRFEWEECQRRLDELDPGCSPSPQTESLYGALRRRVRPGYRALSVEPVPSGPPLPAPRPGILYEPAVSDGAPTSAP